MFERRLAGLILVSAVVVAIVISCSAGTGGLRNVADVPIPNVGTADGGTNFGFDISAIDTDAGRYYFTDRNNKAVDVIDTKTNTLVKQITGTGANAFGGCRFADGGPIAVGCGGASNPNSGPDGLNLIPGTNLMYVGDVGSVKIVDTSTNTITKTVSVVTAQPPAGTDDPALRADEGCYDPDDKILMISSPDQSPPFATFFNTTTGTIVARINFTDSGGLEACVYDKSTKSFFVNNDGSAAYMHGELDQIPASYITNSANWGGTNVTLGVPLPAAGNGFNRYDEGNCDPTGLDLGPGNDIAVSCREGTASVPLLFLIMDKTNGKILATLNAGGADQITYDPVSNRYYTAASRWTPSGLAAKGNPPATAPGNCSSADVCTPTMFIIDASSRTVVSSIPTGNNAHSIAVDGAAHRAYLPYSSGTSPGGCRDCSTTYPNGGVSVIQTE